MSQQMLQFMDGLLKLQTPGLAGTHLALLLYQQVFVLKARTDLFWFISQLSFFFQGSWVFWVILLCQWPALINLGSVHHSVFATTPTGTLMLLKGAGSIENIAYFSYLCNLKCSLRGQEKVFPAQYAERKLYWDNSKEVAFLFLQKWL